MSAIPATKTPAQAAAEAAYTATANAQGALILFVAAGAPLDAGLTGPSLKRAIEGLSTAMNRLSEIVAMLPRAPDDGGGDA